MGMTLDQFQARTSEIVQKLKEEATSLFEQGVESKLDPQLMVAIFNREIEKLSD